MEWSPGKRDPGQGEQIRFPGFQAGGRTPQPRKNLTALVLFLMGMISAAMAAEPVPGTGSGPRNFVFFERQRQRITEPSFLDNPDLIGAQLKYTWRELEPERDRYHFQPVLDDLTFLEKHGKRLFIQIQDVSFDEEVLVPGYLCTDPAFAGGVARKVAVENDDESRATFDGWVARRWDPNVRSRFLTLLSELGKAVDGRIEGVNLPESSIDFGVSGRLFPPGFTCAGYAEAVKEQMSGARRAFPRSVVIQYANFMPGEWLPGEDHGFLRSVYAHAASAGVGVGGPDLLPFRKGQQNHGLALIASRSPEVRAGLAVQDGNLAEKDPATGRPVQAAVLYRFARDRLRLDYLFWGTEEPWYSREVLPFLRRLRGLGR